MANPYFDTTNNTWKIKVKTDKGWKPRILGPGKPGQPIPDDLLRLAMPFMSSQSKVAEVVTETTDGTTLKAYCDLYFKRYLKREGSIRRLKNTLTQFLEFADKHKLKLLTDIGVKELNLFVDARRDKGTENSTICSDLAQLQGLFSMAIEEQVYLGMNPVKSPASKVRQAIATESAETDDDDLQEEIKYYTREQQVEIFEKLDLFGNPKYVDFVKIMLATGMRAEALVNLDFKWVKDGYVRIPKRWDKGKAGYTTYLCSKESQRIIARRFEHFKEGRVFPDINSTTQVYHYLDRFYRSHKLTHIADMGSCNHAWRHTFAVNRIDDKWTIEVLQKFMGHHSIKVTQKYAKVSDNTLQAAVAMLESKINN
jgi:integrase